MQHLLIEIQTRSARSLCPILTLNSSVGVKNMQQVSMLIIFCSGVDAWDKTTGGTVTLHHSCTYFRLQQSKSFQPHYSSLSPLSSSQSGSPTGQGCGPTSPQDEAAATGVSPPSSSCQSPVSKSFYPRHGTTSKYLIGWRKPGGTVNSVDFGNTRK